MKIIISPAKKMNTNSDDLLATTTPMYLDKSKEIFSRLKSLSYDNLQLLWKCNDKIADENYARIQSMNLNLGLTPAILAYEGIQYKYMAPTIFEDKMLTYVSEHLRILSGFYGVLRPMDGVIPYRLEMQAKFDINGSNSLYEFWGKCLYRECSSDGMILNLASKEYSKSIEKYLLPTDKMVTCIFGELIEGKVVQKATYAKMARGEMVRYMAEHNIQDFEDVKNFNGLDFSYNKKLSNDTTFIFIR